MSRLLSIQTDSIPEDLLSWIHEDISALPRPLPLDRKCGGPALDCFVFVAPQRFSRPHVGQDCDDGSVKSSASRQRLDSPLTHSRNLISGYRHETHAIFSAASPPSPDGSGGSSKVVERGRLGRWALVSAP